MCRICKLNLLLIADETGEKWLFLLEMIRKGNFLSCPEIWIVDAAAGGTHPAIGQSFRCTTIFVDTLLYSLCKSVFSRCLLCALDFRCIILCLAVCIQNPDDALARLKAYFYSIGAFFRVYRI